MFEVDNYGWLVGLGPKIKITSQAYVVDEFKAWIKEIQAEY